MAPALRFPVKADLSDFETSMSRLKLITGDASRTVMGQMLQMSSTVQSATSSIKAGVGAGGAAVLAMGAALALAVIGWKALGAITQMAKEKIEEYSKIAADAAERGVTPEFFQRLGEASKGFGGNLDEVGKALKKLKEGTEETLGSKGTITDRLDALVKAGNFEGNKGVEALGNANTVEERYRALVVLITEASAKGERLAALDLAAKFLPPAMLESLRSNNEALAEMQVRADKLAASKIISEEDVNRAADLKRRMEEAQKILEEKWKPIQQDLISLGLNYHDNWVSIVQRIAEAVNKVNDLYQALKKIPELLSSSDFAQSGFWKKLTEFTEGLGLNSDPASLGIIDTGANPRAAENPELVAAKRLLQGRLTNPSLIREGQRQATDLQSKVRGDTSTDPTKDEKEVAEQKNDFDRATESIQRHTATTLASAEAAGLGAGAQAELRAEALLTEALLRSGIEINDEYAKKMTELATAAGKAAEALEKARDRAPIAQFARDAANLEKQLVQTSVHAFQSFENAFVGFAMGTKTASAAFKEMTNSIIADLIKIAIRQSITGPLASLLSSSLSSLSSAGPASATAKSMSSIFPKMAGGGVIPPHGVALVSEHSPNARLIRAGREPIMVTPHEVAGRGEGGGSLQVSFGGPSIIIQGDVSEKTARMIEFAIARENAKLAGKMSQILPDLRRRSVRGV